MRVSVGAVGCFSENANRLITPVVTRRIFLLEKIRTEWPQSFKNFKKSFQPPKIDEPFTMKHDTLQKLGDAIEAVVNEQFEDIAQSRPVREWGDVPPGRMEAAIALDYLVSQIRKLNSPWTNRHGAADYAHCSTKTIDRAADAGKIKRYFGIGEREPRFKKAELDKWIEGKA